MPSLPSEPCKVLVVNPFPTAFVLTLRADFIPQCTAYRGLATQLSANQYLVSPMSEAGLQHVIEGPARLDRSPLPRLCGRVSRSC